MQDFRSKNVFCRLSMGNACSSAWSNFLPSFFPDPSPFTAVSLTFASSSSACGVFSVLDIFFQRYHQHGCQAQLWPVVALELPESAPHPAQMDRELVLCKERADLQVQPLSYMCSLGRSWHSEGCPQD